MMLYYRNLWGLRTTERDRARAVALQLRPDVLHLLVDTHGWESAANKDEIVDAAKQVAREKKKNDMLWRNMMAKS